MAKRRCAAPSDLEWSSARPGRFVQGDGEWLVSLAGPCIRGCPGVTFIARKTGGRWTTLGGDEQLVTESCVTVRGLADGLDRVACAGAAGPHQGSMAVFVDVRRYAKDASDDQLLYKEHGGECFFAEPPAKAEFDGDELSDLSPGDAGSDTALTVRLTVRRAECDRTVEDPEARATVRGEHVLRFVKRGNAVVPDARHRGAAWSGTGGGRGADRLRGSAGVKSVMMDPQRGDAMTDDFRTQLASKTDDELLEMLRDRESGD